LIEAIQSPLESVVEEKAGPMKAPEDDGIRRTHSDTTALGRNILSEMYRTEPVHVPDVPHQAVVASRDSHSPVSMKTGESKREESAIASGGLKASKATLDRISDAFSGHTTTALFKK
jgi:hypothetical protein